MIEKCCYNKFRDNEFVVGGLSIDLDAALRTGIVKDLGTEVEYNGIEDPNLIDRRVSDVFDAIDSRNSVVHKELNRLKDTNKETKSTPTSIEVSSE